MAGSLNHITADDGTFRMGLIENMGDAHEALQECHQIIAELLSLLVNPEAALAGVCRDLSYPDTAMPVRQPELHGAESIYKAPHA